MKIAIKKWVETASLTGGKFSPGVGKCEVPAGSGKNGPEQHHHAASFGSDHLWKSLYQLYSKPKMTMKANVLNIVAECKLRTALVYVCLPKLHINEGTQRFWRLLSLKRSEKNCDQNWPKITPVVKVKKATVAYQRPRIAQLCRAQSFQLRDGFSIDVLNILKMTSMQKDN